MDGQRAASADPRPDPPETVPAPEPVPDDDIDDPASPPCQMPDPSRREPACPEPARVPARTDGQHAGRHASGAERARIIAVTLTSLDGKRALGALQAAERTSAGRCWHAFKALAVCWAIGLGAALIPIAHFVLVPAMLLAGPFAALAASRRGRFVTAGCAECPSCRSRLVFRPGSSAAGFSQTCFRCSTQVSIAPVAAGAA